MLILAQKCDLRETRCGKVADVEQVAVGVDELQNARRPWKLRRITVGDARSEGNAGDLDKDFSGASKPRRAGSAQQTRRPSDPPRWRLPSGSSLRQ